MQVRDVMTPNVISIAEDDTIVKAARIMLQNRISGLPVVDAAGKLVGVVTEGDFLATIDTLLGIDPKTTTMAGTVAVPLVPQKSEPIKDLVA